MVRKTYRWKLSPTVFEIIKHTRLCALSWYNSRTIGLIMISFMFDFLARPPLLFYALHKTAKNSAFTNQKSRYNNWANALEFLAVSNFVTYQCSVWIYIYVTRLYFRFILVSTSFYLLPTSSHFISCFLISSLSFHNNSTSILSFFHSQLRWCAQ